MVLNSSVIHWDFCMGQAPFLCLLPSFYLSSWEVAALWQILKSGSYYYDNFPAMWVASISCQSIVSLLTEQNYFVIRRQICLCSPLGWFLGWVYCLIKKIFAHESTGQWWAWPGKEADWGLQKGLFYPPESHLAVDLNHSFASLSPPQDEVCVLFILFTVHSPIVTFYEMSLNLLHLNLVQSLHFTDQKIKIQRIS